MDAQNHTTASIGRPDLSHDMLKVLTKERSARAIALEVAERYGLTHDDILAHSDCPVRAKARKMAVYEVRQKKGWSWNQLAAHFQRGRSVVRRYYEEIEKSVPSRGAQPTQDVEVEAQFRRLSGVDTSLKITEVLGIEIWKALFLGVLAETYPRIMPASNLLELYDAAAVRSNYKPEGTFANDWQLRQFSSQIKKWAASEGLPVPLEHHRAGMITLSRPFAFWLHNQVGRPVMIFEETG